MALIGQLLPLLSRAELSGQLMVYSADSSFSPPSAIIGNPASGPSLTVTSPVGWQAIQAQSTIQITGPHNLTNANQNVNTTQLLLHGYAAEMVSINGSAGTDQKVWSNFADSSGVYHFRLEDDALSFTYDWMAVTRTGAVAAGTRVDWFSGTQSTIRFQQSDTSTYAVAISTGSSLTSKSNGLKIQSGTNSSDAALQIINAANTYNLLQVVGNGLVKVGGSGGPGSGITSLQVFGTASNTAPVATFGGTSSNFITITDGAGLSAVVQASTGLGVVLGASSNSPVLIKASNNTVATFGATSSTSTALVGPFACNGVVPAAPPTGYGTPTGGSHQASFSAGSITLSNLAAAVAQLIIDLKNTGLIAT